MTNSFSKFSLDPNVLKAVQSLGYETPTPVQEQSIPILQEGFDLLAQAQTGTGKTAAFALPLLSKIDASKKTTQALVLAPTRELAIQVAENIQAYAKHLDGFKAVAIYGGQDFKPQLTLLKRGVQVVVGTPGRLMDHMERGTLKLDDVEMLVIDEADEMLKMGFIDDVEWILSHIKKPHQTALFSATLPGSIVKMAQKYLKNPKRVEIKSQKNAVETISQFYVMVSRDQKLAVLMRFLALEENQGVIIFARTKNDSAVLSEKLQAQGYKAAALNGDMSQSLREKTIDRLKSGALNIVVATDVAARGLDVERITHVFNYDMPFDMDSYVHRIGRTGRAGREGKAILFVTPREMRFVQGIERHTNRTITQISPPDLSVIQQKRLSNIGAEVAAVIEKQGEKLNNYIEMIKTITNECKCSSKEIAAALLFLKESKSRFDDNYEAPKDKKRFDDRRGQDRKPSRDRGGFRDRNDRGGSKDDRKKSFRRDENDRGERGEKRNYSEKKSSGDKKPRYDKKESFNKGGKSDRKPFSSSRPKRRED